MEQLKVGTNDLPSVVKKNVVAAVASVSSTEAFPMVMAARIRSRKVGEECWNSGLDGRLEAMAASIHLKAIMASIHLEATAVAMLEAARLWETLPMAS
jgi:hypothetical protein